MMSPTTFSPSTATAPSASKSSRKLRQSFRDMVTARSDCFRWARSPTSVRPRRSSSVKQGGLEPRSELHGRIPSLPTRAKSRHVTEQDDLGSCHDESHGMSHRHHSDRAATRDDRHDGCGAPYLVAGFSVVATAMGTKRPLFPWIEFQSRRPTAAEMSAWYRRDPQAGVAIVCEAVSGLAVVDFDPRNSDGTARAVPRQEFCCLRQP